jgi:Cft2 family RNA processing exonuclease
MPGLNGFGARADQAELLAFASAIRERGPLREVVLVHSEPAAQDTLKEQLSARGFPSVRIPPPGDLLRL